MPRPDTADQLGDADWDRCEAVVARFAAEWRAAPAAPDLEPYLAGFPHRRALLLELAHTDLELRARAGLPAAAADYLDRFPELVADPRAAAGLVAAALRHRAAAPGLVGGRYRVHEEIGRGSFAPVYRGWDEQLGRPVALKRAPGGDGVAATAQLVWEARALAAVDHAGVVRVHDAVVEPDGVWLVEEYVPGPTLAEWAAATRPDPRAAAALVAALADAVHAVHQAGLVHRDLKPANVLIDPAGAPRLADFGLSRPSSATATTWPVGTPAYMAPEQAAGGRVAPTADVYSLGAVLYELLTGTVPHPGDAATVLHRLATDAPPPPHPRTPAVPPPLDAVCRTAMARTPAARYPSAAALAADLRRFLAGQTVRGSRRRRARRWAAVALGWAVAAVLWLSAGEPGPSAAPPPARSAGDEVAADLLFDAVAHPALEVGDGKPARRQLLEAAVRRLGVAARSDDPVVRFQLATAADLYVGHLTRDGVVPAETGPVHATAWGTWERLAAEHPGVAAFRLGAARAAYRYAGFRADGGEPAAADDLLARAEAEFEAALATWPPDPIGHAAQVAGVRSPGAGWLAGYLARRDDRRVRTWALWEGGVVVGRRGRAAEARARLDAAARLAVEAAAACPTDTRHQARAEWHEIRADGVRWRAAAGDVRGAAAAAREIGADVRTDLADGLRPADRVRPLAAAAAVAAVLEEVGDGSTAADLRVAAAGEWERVAAAMPDRPEYARQGGCEWHQVGNLRAAADPARAEAAYRTALAVRTTLRGRHPDNLRFRLDASATGFSLGRLLARAGRPAAAEPYLREAHADLLAVCRTDPGNATFRRWLGDRREWLRRVLQDLGRPADAAGL
ncbi:MAG: serine/threonine-protein kinase [Gemmataceae bacterium]